MELNRIGLRAPAKVNIQQANVQAEEINKDVTSQRQTIPNTIFIIRYKIDNVEHEFNLRRLFEIDVTELSELTLNNLRTQLEQISSIRMTLERAYEQMMEDYGRYKIEYDIWLAEAFEAARNKYWEGQVFLKTKHNLAASGMKAPTQEDLLHTALRIVGTAVDYTMKQEKIIAFQRAKSLYEKIDEILNSRAFDLKAIIDSRLSKSG